MAILMLTMVFWVGVFLVARSIFAAKKTGHEAELLRLRAQMKGVDTSAPAPTPAKGPSLAAKAANGAAQATAQAVKFTAPRVVAGTAVLAKSAHKAGKAAVAKVAEAKAQPQPAEMTPVSGGNVLTPEQEKQMETPAFMRAGKHLDGNVVHFPGRNTLH